MVNEVKKKQLFGLIALLGMALNREALRDNTKQSHTLEAEYDVTTKG